MHSLFKPMSLISQLANARTTLLGSMSNAKSEAPPVHNYKWTFLFPEIDMQDGGYLAQMRFAKLFRDDESIAPSQRHVTFATYKKSHSNTASLNELLNTPAHEDNSIYCVHYGPHIKRLLRRLKGRRVVYFAHSVGWNFRLPKHIPIVSVSKHCMSYWAKHAPDNPSFYLPNIIDEKFHLPKANDEQREIDILVIQRKMSNDLISKLVPELQKYLRVKVITEWDDDIQLQMMASKIFLYDSSQYWKSHRATEGFGLPPLEAIACGCALFSSLNDGLSDFLDTSENCQQLYNSDLKRNVANILNAIKNWSEPIEELPLLKEYRPTQVQKKLSRITKRIESYFEQPSFL